ncbi:branched-chain amino acid ABC transporter permease [Bradyrhizobium sp. 200]|uniref:branched-chain amino acid ABC transporter permease n=1 Tax=Bradyrhizobium sp. 200 TaxID=2782665 RepID=UPI002049F986|nr:branched-chain amino acid ABC transporter permease [Bradyrhizobium sp. 200]UPJ48421.1 branched-chain amino acid ABC transporter permease [Bradyrhizobium sp. 200]
MDVVQQIVNGLVIGSGYACIALGWTVLLGAARLVNFAHGQMYMLAAFVCWFILTRMGLAFPIAAALTVVCFIVLGIALQLLMNRLVMTQNLTSLMIVTLGIGYVLQGGAGILFGGAPQTFRSELSRIQFRMDSVWFTAQDLLVLVMALFLYAAVWYFLNRTSQGSSIRAVAEDPKLAQLLGIDPRVVYVVIFVIEAVLVATSAILVAPRSPILTSMGFDEVIITFVVVVLGGVGSVGGALIASFAIGQFTALFGALVSPAYVTAAIFGVLMLFLIARPKGLSFR